MADAPTDTGWGWPGFFSGLADLLQTATVEVGGYFHALPDLVAQRPAGWVLTQFHYVRRARWNDDVRATLAVELGVSRALAIAFGAKGTHLPDIPTYDEMLAQQQTAAPKIPRWMAEFEKANAGRLAVKVGDR
jgi:hypothetical protein